MAFGDRTPCLPVPRALPLLVAVAWFAVGTGTATAVQSTRLQVRQEGEAYLLYAEMVVDAPLRKVYALLTDYDRLERLNDVVKESELMDSTAENRHRVYSVAETCVLMFCTRLKHVQEVYETPHREILALTVPEESDLKEGTLHWRLRPAESGTALTAFVRVVPDFWIPPLIGPWAVKRALRDQVRSTADNLERLAMAGSESTDESPR